MSDENNSTPLGIQTAYPDHYDADLLCPVSRAEGRRWIIDNHVLPNKTSPNEKLADEWPFKGVDYWNAYEVSWLNDQGKPQIGIIEFAVPFDSPNIVESKSLKLYLNSLNQHRFSHHADVVATVSRDLEQVIGSPVDVKLHTEIDHEDSYAVSVLKGECIDHLDIQVDQFAVDSTILQTFPDKAVSETLYSHLLRSNCPVTGQPDWASLMIRYQGPTIQRESLLRYIISYRTHNEFHEQCVERIFMDILHRCRPTKLTVYARYTRRGGIDINPFRSNFEMPYPNARLARQ